MLTLTKQLTIISIEKIEKQVKVTIKKALSPSYLIIIIII